MSQVVQISHKPAWLKIRMNGTDNYRELKHLIQSGGLHTVCEEARCPNIHECWGKRRTVTFMILGDTCTRACGFCAVKSGRPDELDLEEPEQVAKTVARLELRHVVITAVARDDLADGGAAIFTQTIRAVRRKSPACTVEVLPSDMGGIYKNLKILMDAKPDILNHNVETVRRLSDRVRSKAKYDRSLEFLRRAKEMEPWSFTKSSLMLGLGETKTEIIETMTDLRAHRVDILTMGQYIPPSKMHAKYLPVIKYWRPDEFAELREIALQKGFSHCEAGPKVRSSYHADEQARRLRPDSSENKMS